MASSLIDFSFLGTKAQWETIIRSPEFDLFLFLCIIAQCYTLADVDPKATTDAFGTYIANYIYDLIFLFEFVVKIIVLGRIKYFINRWHAVDAFVAIIGFIELLFALIVYCDESLAIYDPNLDVLSSNSLSYLKAIRLIRLLKTLKSLALIPSITVFMKSAFACFEKIFVVLTLMLGVLILVSFVAYARVGNKLQYRCLPDSSSQYYSDVTSSAYFTEYGIDFYKSKYNMATCGNSAYPCADGYYCGYIGDNLRTFQGVGADMSTPFRAFITILAFLTLRGWPNIFWSLATTTSTATAALLFLLILTLGVLVVLNLLPAAFVVTLKNSKERIRKLNWLMLYPGNLETVSEIELFMWARHFASNTEIALAKERKEDRSVVGRVTALVNKYFPSFSKEVEKKKLDAMMESKLKVEMDRKKEIESATSRHNEMEFEDEEKEYLTEDFEKEDNKKVFGIPPGKTCERWRAIFNSETGIFQILMNAVNVFQIILQSMESTSQSTVIADCVYYGNICVVSIYLFEVSVKVATLGPCLYFSIPVNVFDFILTFASMPSLAGRSTFTSASTLRILRIFRLMRVVSLYIKMSQKTQELHGGTNNASSDYSIDVNQVLNVLRKLIPELVNVSALMMTFTFIMAILGMQVFGHYSEVSDIISLNSTYNSSLVAPLYGIENLWNAGKYRDRLNFDKFGQSYVTVFNIFTLNGWHIAALEYMRRAGSFAIIFFLVAIFLMNYFLSATLMASSSEIMEVEGHDVLQKMAAHNGNLIHGLQKCRDLFLKRHYFGVYKSAIAEDITTIKHSGGPTNQSGLASKADDLDAYEPPENTFAIGKFIQERRLYSLWIFKPNSIVRIYMHKILSSKYFELVTAAAISIVVANIVTNGTSTSVEDYWKRLQYATTAVFLLEMLFKWIAYGVYGSVESYFYIFNFMNYADFVTNVVLILSYIYPDNTTIAQIDQIRVIRVTRIPVLLQLLSRSQSLMILVGAIRQSMKSLFTIVIVNMIVIYLVAVLLLQVWVGQFGECSSDQYPAGQLISTSSSDFPNGCSGTALIKSSIDDTYNYETLSWTWFTDNTNDIFSTNRLLFRMVTNNEYQGIVYTSMDQTDYYTQPSLHNNRGAFVMYLFSFVISMALSVVTATIVGYHYYINTALKGRKRVFGSDESFFAAYEDKLANLKAGNAQSLNTRGKTRFVYNLEKNIFYRLIFGGIAFAPSIVLLCYFEQTYATSAFIYYDFIVSLFYVADFLFRFFMSTDKWYYVRSSVGEQEIFINLFLVSAIVYVSIMSDTFTNISDLQFRLIYACVVLRIHRLNVVFPDIVGLIVVLKYCIGGFAPLIAYVAALVLIAGVFATAVFGGYTPSYDTDWQNSHFNFKTYVNSWFLLFAIGTGNLYTEVLDAYRPTMGVALTGLLEAFMASFILLFTVIARCFAIMIIAKYVKHYGGNIGIATQQVKEIQRLWAVYSGDVLYITFHDLLKLLAALPAPLGQTNIQNHTGLLRFAKKVLLSMPSSGTGNGDGRNMYEYESLPLDLRDLTKEPVNGMPGTNHMKFTFTQVIVAVHKNFMMPFELTDEASHIQKRQVPLQRVSDLRTRVMCNLADRFVDGGPPSMVVRATRTMLLVQRLDPLQYFASYISLMTTQVQILQKRIDVFGLSGIDSYVLSNLRKAIISEKQAIFHRFKFYKSHLVTINRKLTLEFKVLDKYNASIRSLDQTIEQLYSLNIDQEWKLESISHVKSFQSKQNVTAIAMDNACSVYAAFGDTGILKIWKNISVNTSVVNSNSKFKLTQKMTLGAPIKALQLRSDAKVLVAGCGNEIIVLASASGGGLKGRKSAVKGFVEQSRLSDHTGAITSLVIFNNYLFSSSLDGLIYLWNFRSLEPLNSYNTGSSIFCMHVFSTKQENMPEDNMIISHSVVVGTKSGKIMLLPVPFKTSNETKAWGAVSYNVSGVSVSAIQSAWGYLYVGLADGTLKTYAVDVAGKEEAEAYKNNPIGIVSLKPLATTAVHTGPITSLCHTGGTLFSSSHDFSVVPWLKPDIGSKSKSNFSQIYAGGMVFHSSPIICAASNKVGLVTADEGGQVIISSPSSTEDVLQFGASEFLQSNVRFSFLEYDFGFCSIEHHSIKSEEDAYLRITNTSNKQITVRCLLKSYVDSIFTCTVDKHLASAGGIIIESSPDDVDSDMVILAAQQTVMYTVKFSPSVDTFYSTQIQFLISDSHIARLSVRGSGAKPKLAIANHTKIFDFEVVAVGAHKYIYIHISNESNLSIIAHFPECKDDNKKNGVETVINVFPKVLLIGPKKIAKVALKYSPREKTPSFQIPLIVEYSGWSFTLTTLRGRADEPHNVTNHHGNSHNNHISPVVQTSYLERNLRPLQKSECILPGPLVVPMLFSKGWLVTLSNNLAVLVHPKNGQFLEIPRSVTGADTPMGKNALLVTYKCPFDTYCEVKCGKNVIAKREGSSLSGTVIKIEPHEIFADEHVHNDDENRIKFSIGYHTLFVKVYLRSGSSNQKPKAVDLLHTTSIKVMKGLRVSRVRDDDIIEFEDRLNVVGIEKTQQNILDAPGCFLDESFSVDINRTGISASLFPMAVVTLSPINDPTHIGVTDSITGESAGKKTKINLDATIVDKFNSLNGTESVMIPDPKLRSAISDSNLVRSLKIKYYRKDISASAIPLSQTTPVKEMSLHCHVASGLIGRAKKAGLSTSQLLAHNIYSQTHSIGVKVDVEDGDALDATGNSFNNTVASTEAMIDQMFVNQGHSRDRTELSAIFGQWFFLLSDGEIKLVSADYDRSDYQSTEVIFSSNGFNAALESGATISTSDTVIEFVEVGIKNNPTNKGKVLSFVNRNDKKFNTQTNLSMPVFVSDIWELLLTDNFINSVKAHMRYCAIKQAQIESAKNSSDISTPENTKITYKYVYAELTRLTSLLGTIDANAKEKPALNIKKLSIYFQTFPIKGYEEPLSFSQIDIAFRELDKSSSGLITMEAFKKWYLDKSVKSKIQEVNERTYFALLFDETLKINARVGGDEEYEEYEQPAKSAKSNKKSTSAKSRLSIGSMFMNSAVKRFESLTHHDGNNSGRRPSIRDKIASVRSSFFKKGDKEKTKSSDLGGVEMVSSTEIDDVQLHLSPVMDSLVDDERKSANDDDDEDDDDEDDDEEDDDDDDYGYDDEGSGSESGSSSSSDDDDDDDENETLQSEQYESSNQIRKTVIK